MTIFLDFEQAIFQLENQIADLKNLSDQKGLDINSEVQKLEDKVQKLLKQMYSKLTPWQKVQVARHQLRPQFFDYLEFFKDFTPLAGDRCFGDDQAIIGGIGRLREHSVMVIGQQKGKDTESRLKHNFGMPKPEGYRKAIRLMEMADQFKLPVITFVDTSGAYPGIDAEERGQAQAIAASIQTCLEINVPIISIVIGEGGSGGAIAIAAANIVLMLEHSVYSVISPEGCASILWRSATKASDAAAAQKLTAQDLMKLKVIDDIIPEPVGGAHRYPDLTIKSVEATLYNRLNELMNQSMRSFKEHREEKFLKMGQL